ncbi:hypothetical protein INR49_017968 [Caranx melampygus]|nr:hypothetical protein INR49_017968 [Caranx melampygus]
MTVWPLRPCAGGGGVFGGGGLWTRLWEFSSRCVQSCSLPVLHHPLTHLFPVAPVFQSGTAALCQSVVCLSSCSLAWTCSPSPSL